MTNLQYTLDLESVAAGYLDVRLKVLALGEDATISLSLPVWTPGSYLIREYAQFLRDMKAIDASGERRKIKKTDKSTWEVDCHNTTELTISYRLYGQTLNVRYNHFDSTHAFIHGPATFLYVVGGDDEPISVDLINTDWNVTTGLKKIAPTAFLAENFDMLVDCPLEVGDNYAVDFEVLGKVHRFEFWGEGNYDAKQIVSDTQKIISTAASLFDSKLPYDSFSFITHLTEKDYGGLEHRNSTALMVPRNSFRSAPSHEGSSNDDESYRQFLGLVSHEFFHTWNVKRIKPGAFNKFDYQNENHTRDMWTVEGITSYYDDLILQRAGLISREVYLERVAKMISRLEQTPGRKICSLEDASFDTWIRLYRPNPVNHNSNVSYYLKGSLVSLLLDLTIRHKSKNEKSLDDVLYYLWTHHAEANGYAEGSYESIVEKVCEIDCDDFFEKHIRGVADADWNQYFKPFGLTLNCVPEDHPYLGVQLKNSMVVSVDDESPASGKLLPDDEIIAVDAKRFTGDLSTLLKTYSSENCLQVSGFRNGLLFSIDIELQAARSSSYSFEIDDKMDKSTKARFDKWLR